MLRSIIYKNVFKYKNLNSVSRSYVSIHCNQIFGVNNTLKQQYGTKSPSPSSVGFIFDTPKISTINGEKSTIKQENQLQKTIILTNIKELFKKNIQMATELLSSYLAQKKLSNYDVDILFMWVTTNGYLVNIDIINLFLQEFGSTHNLQNISKLINLCSSKKIPMNLETYEILIRHFTLSNMEPNLISIIDRLFRSNIPISNETTYPLLVQAYLMIGDITNALKYFEATESNQSGWNGIMKYYVTQKQFDKAIDMFKQHITVYPSYLSTINCSNFFYRLEEPQNIEECIQYLEENDLADQEVIQSIISLLLEKSLKLATYLIARRKFTAPNNALFIKIIRQAIMEDDLKTYLQILSDMSKNYIRPSTAAYQWVLASCVSSQNTESINQIIESLCKLSAQGYEFSTLIYYNQVNGNDELLQILLQALMNQPQSFISQVTEQVIGNYLHFGHYDMALNWYAERILNFSIKPTPELYLRFIDYHKLLEETELMEFWADQLQSAHGYLVEINQDNKLLLYNQLKNTRTKKEFADQPKQAFGEEHLSLSRHISRINEKIKIRQEGDTSEDFESTSVPSDETEPSEPNDHVISKVEVPDTYFDIEKSIHFIDNFMPSKVEHYQLSNPSEQLRLQKILQLQIQHKIQMYKRRTLKSMLIFNNFTKAKQQQLQLQLQLQPHLNLQELQQEQQQTDQPTEQVNSTQDSNNRFSDEFVTPLVNNNNDSNDNNNNSNNLDNNTIMENHVNNININDNKVNNVKNFYKITLAEHDLLLNEMIERNDIPKIIVILKELMEKGVMPHGPFLIKAYLKVKQHSFDVYQDLLESTPMFIRCIVFNSKYYEELLVLDFEKGMKSLQLESPMFYSRGIYNHILMGLLHRGRLDAALLLAKVMTRVNMPLLDFDVLAKKIFESDVQDAGYLVRLLNSLDLEYMNVSSIVNCLLKICIEKGLTNEAIQLVEYLPDANGTTISLLLRIYSELYPIPPEQNLDKWYSLISYCETHNLSTSQFYQHFFNALLEIGQPNLIMKVVENDFETIMENINNQAFYSVITASSNPSFTVQLFKMTYRQFDHYTPESLKYVRECNDALGENKDPGLDILIDRCPTTPPTHNHVTPVSDEYALMVANYFAPTLVSQYQIENPDKSLPDFNNNDDIDYKDPNEADEQKRIIKQKLKELQRKKLKDSYFY
ncbi:Metacaspase-like protein [Tieghemostelium lacteum]|uniref:Metacaspase-like protein n=1 Tax=Tieghemostelium lacteum TaxID=361077 RepID=A0A151ZBB9_TIELA|nr:Metacaspase-like protein [Tieghemostelium lacteum]|eukprot:KYQ91242.1 Metacaspase-like protein [Tieghemostelium lacteum]